VAREANLRELGEAMSAIEAAAKRVQKSVDTLKDLRSGDLKIIGALLTSVSDLESIRRRLHHEGYLAEPQTALFIDEAPRTNGSLLQNFGETNSQ
jgi:hypothetical protein